MAGLNGSRRDSLIREMKCRMGCQGWSPIPDLNLGVDRDGCQLLPTIANPLRQPSNPLRDGGSNLLNPSWDLLF
jgi:hypothetical protein